MGKKKVARKKYIKKSGVNKSDAIRDYYSAHPQAGPTEVQKELGKKRIKVSTALVSNVKARALSNKPGRKKGARKGSDQTKPLEDVRQAGGLMLEAVDLVLNAGAKEAKQLVKMAENMVNTIRDKE